MHPINLQMTSTALQRVKIQEGNVFRPGHPLWPELIVTEERSWIGNLPNPLDGRVHNVIDLLLRGPSRQIYLPELAEEVSISESRLSHLFRQELRVSALQYLKAIKMQQAAWLLLTTSLTINQITQQTGIHDLCHFVTDFRQLYGMSPRKYQLTQQEGRR